MSPEESIQLVSYWAAVASIASSIITVVGFPILLIIFFRERRRERLTREAETYFKSNEKYIQYRVLCQEIKNNSAKKSAFALRQSLRLFLRFNL
jgi:hypothetical protein